MKHSLVAKQQQMISQHQLVSLELLALGNSELDQYLAQEYLENPMLEQTSLKSPSLKQHDVIGSYQGVGEFDQISNRLVAPVPDHIYTHVYEQLALNRYHERQFEVIDFLIQSLDQNGYIDLSVKEISQLTGIAEQIIQDCLNDLRKLEPSGIFAVDLVDCLLLQLSALELQDEYLERIITEHLTDILHGRISVITRSLALSTARVKQYLAIISTLNPKPLSGLLETDQQYIVPDIVISRNHQEWIIEINDQWSGGNYQLNDYYLQMMARTTEPELIAYFQAKAARARFLIQAIEQRRNTLLIITKCILDQQKSFFTGQGTLLPFTMAQLANQLSLSQSTISRAVRNKYLQYPGGSILMRRLFNTSVTQTATHQITAEQVKGLIQTIVTTENKTKPYSDARLAQLLSEQGIRLSRRVIAKYRDELGIKGSFERKQ